MSTLVETDEYMKHRIRILARYYFEVHRGPVCVAEEEGYSSTIEGSLSKARKAIETIAAPDCMMPDQCNAPWIGWCPDCPIADQVDAELCPVGDPRKCPEIFVGNCDDCPFVI